MTIENLNIDNEGFTSDKIKWFLDVLQGDVKNRIFYRLDKFSDFDIVEVQKHFGNKIEGILIDIDDCIAPAYGNILEENIKKIEELLSMGIKVGFLSNGINGIERTKYLVDKGAVFCNTKESKPSKGSFLEACKIIGTKPQNTLMAGDDISKDGGALQLDENGNSILLGFIPVKPIGNSYTNISFKKWGNYTAKKASRGLTNYINR